MRDLGTHYEFLADVTAEIVLNDTPSMTYTYYQSKIKPNANISEKKVVYVCSVCGYVYEGDELPKDYICP